MGTHLFARGIYDRHHRIAERYTSKPYRVDDRAIREEEEEEEEELYHQTFLLPALTTLSVAFRYIYIIMPNKREGGPRGRENAAEKRGALRTTRSSSAKLHSGIVDVAKKLLDTVHKLENDEILTTTTTTRKERGKRHNSTAAEGKMMMMMENQHQAAGKGREWGDEEMRDAPTETMEEEEEENTKKKNNGTRRINDDDDQVIDDNGIDATMGGTTPRLTTLRRRRRSTPSHRTPEGTPKDEKQVERVVSLVRLILTSKKVKEDKVPALIAPNLYLGSIGAAQSEEQIKEKGITHVLTVARGFEIKNVEGVKYMTVEVADRPDADIRSHFPQCFEFISGAVKSGGNILVHCFAGRSRSASVCAAYIMCHENIRLDEALMRMRLARPQINPNAGFMAQLNQLDEDLMKWRYKTGQEKMKEDEQEVTSAQSQNRDSGQSKSSTSDSYDCSQLSHDQREDIRRRGDERYIETATLSKNSAETVPSGDTKKQRTKAGAASATTESDVSDENRFNSAANKTTNKKTTTTTTTTTTRREATPSKSTTNTSSDQDIATPYHRGTASRPTKREGGKRTAGSSSGSGGSGGFHDAKEHHYRYHQNHLTSPVLEEEEDDDDKRRRSTANGSRKCVLADAQRDDDDDAMVDAMDEGR